MRKKAQAQKSCEQQRRQQREKKNQQQLGSDKAQSAPIKL